jgi:hypothetical protein
MLATNGGVFDIGNVVELGRTRWCGKPPEVEDVLFGERAAKIARRMTGEQLFAELRKRAVPGLQAIGSDLLREGNSLVTTAGRGRCSLVATMSAEQFQVVARNHRDERGVIAQRIRFVRSDDVDLSVTDVRLYESDMLTPDIERVRWLQSRLAESPEVVLCYGLGRPYNGRHYLQLNNLHLSNAPAWRLA